MDEELRELERQALRDPAAALKLLMMRARSGAGPLAVVQARFQQVCPDNELSLGHVSGAIREMTRENKIHTVIGFASSPAEDGNPRTAFVVVGRFKQQNYGVRIYRRPGDCADVSKRYRREAEKFRGHLTPQARSLDAKVWSVVHVRTPSPAITYRVVVKNPDQWAIIDKDTAAILRGLFLDVSMRGPLAQEVTR